MFEKQVVILTGSFSIIKKTVLRDLPDFFQENHILSFSVARLGKPQTVVSVVMGSELEGEETELWDLNHRVSLVLTLDERLGVQNKKNPRLVAFFRSLSQFPVNVEGEFFILSFQSTKGSQGTEHLKRLFIEEVVSTQLN